MIKRISLSLALVSVLLLSACIPSPTSTTTPQNESGDSSTENTTPDSSGEISPGVFEGVQPPYSKDDFGISKIDLINNETAHDPTWAELMAFLRVDDTDSMPYSPSFYMCGSFAEEVHNNAEAAGIKAAWVAIDFFGGGDGHALNVFNTVDKGLVFVDCTGGQLTFGQGILSWDKIAYVVVGKDYGSISVGIATSPEYTFYEGYISRWDEYLNKLDTYNDEVEAYTQALGGRTQVAEPEYSELMAWYNRLNIMENELNNLMDELGDYSWESLGVVTDILIYW